MKIYTRTGDEGKTGLLGGRTHKDDVRVIAYGTIDELNSFIGEAVVRMNEPCFEDIRALLTSIQHDLFDAGCDLAQVGKSVTYLVGDKLTDELENAIDKYELECAPLRNFILPGGSAVSSALHLCRVITRRAERYVVSLCQTSESNNEVRKYLNRLSDLFFVLARTANARLGISDINYKSRNSGPSKE